VDIFVAVPLIVWIIIALAIGAIGAGVTYNIFKIGGSISYITTIIAIGFGIALILFAILKGKKIE
jgi:hypothetical protein